MEEQTQDVSGLRPANFANIHYFKAPDLFVLLDVNSGNIFTIDQETVAVLEHLKSNKGDWLKTQKGLQPQEQEVFWALAELTLAEELFTQDTYLGKYEPPKPLLKSLCLNICHDCDLRCKYCFAGTGNFGGKRTRMDFATGAKALDYLLANSGNRTFLEVDFFGGEPLMNIQVIQELVAYGRKRQQEYAKVLRFTFTTNCVGLTEDITTWALENEISVVLSHDGRKEIHDEMRTFPNGKGSYEIVTANIKKFLARDTKGGAIVRGTFTAYNKDFLADIQHWLNNGFRRISMEPAVELGSDRALEEADLPELAREYWCLAEFYEEKRAQGDGFNFFHFNLDAEHGPCLPKRLTGCGAGYEYMVVTPDGEFYPCHQFVGREGYKLGDVERGVSESAAPLVAQFRQAHVYNKPSCSSCWARFYCSGGCHANADLFHQDLLKPYELGCALAKIRTECSLWLVIKNKEKEAATVESKTNPGGLGSSC